MATSSSLEPSQVIAALTTAKTVELDAADEHQAISEIKTADQDSAISALGDTSGDVAGCGGGGCRAIA